MKTVEFILFCFLLVVNRNFQLNEQSKKKDLNQTVNYQSNQRINHFSHHFNFPYRIQFSKNIRFLKEMGVPKWDHKNKSIF